MAIEATVPSPILDIGATATSAVADDRAATISLTTETRAITSPSGEEAFHNFVGQPVSIVCSSRTLTPHEPGVVRRAVNHFLQKEGDIAVTDVRCVPGDFHARYKALDRIYFYRLLSGPEHLSTFEKNRAWHVPATLDIVEMKKACSVLMGRHDFSSFRASGCQAASPIRTLDELHICEVVPSLYFPSDVERKEMKSESFVDNSVISCMRSNGLSAVNSHEFGHRRRHRSYIVTARARSFLYHQVRLLVGLLKSVGTGEVPASKVEEILNAKSVTAACPMAPACGLYLGNVKHDVPDDLERQH